MNYQRSTTFPEIIIIEPKCHQDSRGFFFETFQAERYAETGILRPFVQDNFSRSSQHTLRGLHYQLHNPQAKLVSVLRGVVWDIALDIRQGSPTFGKWDCFELSDENRRQVYIPEGFAHGFLVLSESADFYYKCTDYYKPGDEYGVLWSDKNLNITWPLSSEPLLSPKDNDYLALNQINVQHLPQYRINNV